MGQGAYIFGCEGPTLSRTEAAFFKDADPWGFILFARNVETPDEVKRLCEDLRSSVGRFAPILIDQEGGRVQRLRAPHWREWLPPLDHAKAGARAMWLRYRIIAHELLALGINVNCAPQLDIAQPDTHPFLRNRCYGTDAGTVIEMGRAAADGLLAGGVLPVMKHIPGHGRSRVDSHLDLPIVTDDKDQLIKSDFFPFTRLADLPMAMTAHLIYQDFDPNAPATTSEEMIRVIREYIGFLGLLMTDDLSMDALCGDVTVRTRAALKAGCDLVLHCNGSLAEMEQIAQAAGVLKNEAQSVANTALGRLNAPDPVDIPALEAELEALMKHAGM
jgi:beta-N-acetylhexosaminidase